MRSFPKNFLNQEILDALSEGKDFKVTGKWEVSMSGDTFLLDLEWHQGTIEVTDLEVSYNSDKTENETWYASLLANHVAFAALFDREHCTIEYK